MKRMLELHAVVHEYIHRSSKERVGAYKNSLTRELSMDDERKQPQLAHIRWCNQEEEESSHNFLTFFKRCRSWWYTDKYCTIRTDQFNIIWLITDWWWSNNAQWHMSSINQEFGKEAIPATTEMALWYSLDFKMQTMDYNINRDQRLLLIRRHFRYIYLWLRKVKRTCVACCI